ncbi:alpha/beta hydrolase [Paralimibaculum aggregatum]|uniref:Alpha/beta hydrolase n=1 Tax=Paralimibaculum aggregatum TaxID=3036245 RepID=A0ABQ6LKL3_9RHOB|nr:alpha/beta hydrolase [Limibaculum sp. NKW23]GMG80830.1 alpha/beta hydrolase [Limibaculum sp. NKW23]
MKSFRTADHRRLAYEDSGGSGPAVLCLAGLTRNSREFSDLAAHLAPRYRVIRLDSRGRGRSEHALDPIAEYTIPVEAGDARALLDHLGLARVAMIGTSRGGILAMALACGAPERVSGIVLNDVGAVVEGQGLLRILSGLGRAPAAASFAEAAAELRAANERAFPDVSLADWERFARRIYDDAEGRPALAYDPELRSAVAAGLDAAGPTVSLWPLFEGLHGVPVLVIRGANSDILLPATVAEMARARPDIETLELAGRGHAPFLDEPEALAAIDGFLARHAG